MTDPFADLIPSNGSSGGRVGYIPGIPKAKDPLDIESKELENESKRLNIRKSRQELDSPGLGTNPNQAFDNKTNLRKEFNSLPEAKNYSESINALGSALRAPDNPQGDLGVIYAFAKIMDPGSVVREGEMDMANSTSSYIQDIYRKYGKIGVGNRLPKEVRQELIQTARAKARASNELYSERYRQYRELAQQNGFDPKEIVGNHLGDTLLPLEKEYLRGLNGGATQGPIDPAGTGDIGFNQEAPKVPQQLSQEQLGQLNAFLKDKPKGSLTPEQTDAVYFGMTGQHLDNAKEWADFYNKHGTFNPEIAYPKPDLSRIRQGDEATDPFLRGFVDVPTMGFSEELAAGVDTLTNGKPYGQNLNYENAVRDYDEQNNPYLRFGGQLAGGAVLPGFGARSAADLAKVGAGYGGAYGVGSTDGNIGQRTLGGVMGAATGAGAGYVFGRGAEALAARAANRPGQPPLVDPVTGALNEPLEALRPGQRVAAAEQFGIDLPLGAATDRGGAIIEKGFDIVPGSAGVMNDGRRIVEDQVRNAVNQVGGKFGSARTLDDAGTALQRGATSWLGRFDKVSGKAYDAIPIPSNKPAVLTNTLNTLGELNSAFSSNPELAAVMKSAKLEQYESALTNGGLSWVDTKALRSRIGYEIGEQRFSDGPTKDQLRALYGSLSEDMRATAAAQGPGALRAFERANTLYKQGQDRIDNALIRILGNDSKTNPEKAAAAIQTIAKGGRGTANIKQLAEIRASTIKDGSWDEVAATLIRLGGQPVNSQGREFSPQTFINWYADMSEPARGLLFGGAKAELRQNLDQFVAVNQRLAGTNALRNTSNSAPGILAGGLVSSAGAALLNPLLGAKLLAGMGGAFGLSKVWTSPGFVRWATGYSKALASGNQSAVKAQIGRLPQLGATNPNIREPIVNLQRALLDAANDNGASRALASEGGEENR